MSEPGSEHSKAALDHILIPLICQGISEGCESHIRVLSVRAKHPGSKERKLQKDIRI